MLNEARAIVHSYEIHKEATVKLRANDRFYDHFAKRLIPTYVDELTDDSALHRF
jgi:hypothetical protein